MSLLPLAGCSNNNNPENDNYRLVVSFISCGGGIDCKALQDLDDYLKNSQQFSHVQYDTYKWGMEGEINYCFSYDELKLSQERKFISEIKNLLGNSNLVIIKEHSLCEN